MKLSSIKFMYRFLNLTILVSLVSGYDLIAAVQTPPAPVRPAAPPNAPYPRSQHARLRHSENLPDGANAPANADGNFILGPTHNPAPEMDSAGGRAAGNGLPPSPWNPPTARFIPASRASPTPSARPTPPTRQADRHHQPSRSLHAPGGGVRPQAIRPRHRRALHRGRRWT